MLVVVEVVLWKKQILEPGHTHVPCTFDKTHTHRAHLTKPIQSTFDKVSANLLFSSIKDTSESEFLNDSLLDSVQKDNIARDIHEAYNVRKLKILRPKMVCDQKPNPTTWWRRRQIKLVSCCCCYPERG